MKKLITKLSEAVTKRFQKEFELNSNSTERKEMAEMIAEAATASIELYKQNNKIFDCTIIRKNYTSFKFSIIAENETECVMKANKCFDGDAYRHCQINNSYEIVC